MRLSVFGACLYTTKHCGSTNINSIRYVEIYIYIYLEIILFNLLNLLNIKCRRWCYSFLLTGQDKHIPRTDRFLKVITSFFLPSTLVCSFSAFWTGFALPTCLSLINSTDLAQRLGLIMRRHEIHAIGLVLIKGITCMPDSVATKVSLVEF